MAVINGEFRHRRVFVAVAENRSFSDVSKQLLITQPALTRTIQQLEAETGVRLLERTSRSVSLTTAGQQFLPRAQRILRDLDQALSELSAERVLRIGFSWVLPDPWVTHTVTRFEDATGATARLIRRDDVGAALTRGDIDMGLIRYPPSPGTTSIPLGEEPRVAAVSTHSELAQRHQIGWDELGTHPVIVNTANGSTRPELWPPDSRPTQIIECGNYDEWITLIAAHKGVGATPLSATHAYAHSGIVFIP